MDPANGKPDDYSELFEVYFPMMRSVVFKSGIASEDVEDVAMDILARFIERDGIDYYDPEMLHDVGENPELPGARLRKAKFKGMLRGFTATYVMQYRDKQMMRHRKIPWRLDLPVWAPNAKHEQPWSEVNLRAVDGGVLDVEVSQTVIQALRQARETLSERSTLVRDYETFTALCTEHGLLDGKIDRKAISIEMGVSLSTVSAMLMDLRSTLRHHLAS